MTHQKPDFLAMDGEQILEIYNRRFPKWPYGTPESQEVLPFALELAVFSFDQGVVIGRRRDRRPRDANS